MLGKVKGSCGDPGTSGPGQVVEGADGASIRDTDLSAGRAWCGEKALLRPMRKNVKLCFSGTFHGWNG